MTGPRPSVPPVPPGAERRRLAEAGTEAGGGAGGWRWWGPYLSARQWGTVREDYSADGGAWDHFPHDHARSRAYRWGEDGLLGICDHWQHLCFALALWNGRDPIVKERLFGLANGEGNHGEDVKEYWWVLDGTPTHSYMRATYRYPQAEYPYAALVEGNGRRGGHEPELELIDTGVFDGDRFFDVTVTYAKAAADDICIRIDCENAGPEAAELHVLPTLWFRNTWAWGRDERRPRLAADGSGAIVADHLAVGRRWLTTGTAGDGLGGPGTPPELLFCDNETNTQRLWGLEGVTAYPKDGVNDHVVSGAATVNPKQTGTKAAAWYRVAVA
ncbi:MAG: MGH1-like glycoside hydrolase domain-containing protein, partial [Pseudonocardiaceae bacterium]